VTRYSASRCARKSILGHKKEWSSRISGAPVWQF
jgi:hypothetical protein